MPVGRTAVGEVLDLRSTPASRPRTEVSTIGSVVAGQHGLAPDSELLTGHALGLAELFDPIISALIASAVPPTVQAIRLSTTGESV